MKKNITIPLIMMAMMLPLALHAQGWKLNWQSVSSSEKIKFFDMNTGYACSGYMSASYSHAILLKTTNAGTDWQQIRFDSSRGVRAFDFLTPDYGFVAVQGTAANVNSIRKTTNGGVSWSRTNFSFPGGFKGIKVISQQLIYAFTYPAANGNFFFKSTDGGSSWSATATEVNYEFEFLDANTGFILGNNTIRKTTDGGSSWQPLPIGITDPLNAPTGFHFYNATHGFLISDSGLVMRTTDGGIS